MESDGLPAAWYRAGPEDAEEVALTRHLGFALGSALADPTIIEAASSGRVADLVRGLDRPAVGPARLVVDDLHEIAGTSAEAALETFLRLRPRTITSLWAAAGSPGSNTSRLLVSGELIMVDGEDLRFRSWEVEQLFRAGLRRTAHTRGRRRSDPADGRLGRGSAAVPPGHHPARSGGARDAPSPSCRGGPG